MLNMSCIVLIMTSGKTRSKCACLARGSCEIPVNQEHVIKKPQKTSQFQVWYEYLS